MNPETNKFEMLLRMENDDTVGMLLRPNGEPVPKNWTLFSEGEHVNIKDFTFEVAHIGETYLVLEPIGPIIIGEK